jgi:hypothetical protein
MRDLIEFLWSSTTLALRGALLQDMWGTVLRAAAATLAGTVVGIALLFASAPLWLAVLLGSLVASALTPYLLRNIKIA